jgi:hypothetical protein
LIGRPADTETKLLRKDELVQCYRPANGAGDARSDGFAEVRTVKKRWQ